MWLFALFVDDSAGFNFPGTFLHWGLMLSGGNPCVGLVQTLTLRAIMTASPSPMVVTCDDFFGPCDGVVPDQHGSAPLPEQQGTWVSRFSTTETNLVA
jgi:hypothetical protein